MKKPLTRKEFYDIFGEYPEDCETDEEGQLIIYTGYCLDEDGNLEEFD